MFRLQTALSNLHFPHKTCPACYSNTGVSNRCSVRKAVAQSRQAAGADLGVPVLTYISSPRGVMSFPISQTKLSLSLAPRLRSLHKPKSQQDDANTKHLTANTQPQ